MRQLRMRLSTLEAIPEVALLPGDMIGEASMEQAQPLAMCLAAAFPQEGFTPEKVLGELLDHPEVFATFIITRADQIVATASCKRTDQAELGYLHWCAVHPTAQGSRLGRIVCAAVLARFGREGMTQAILDTDDHRLPAVKTYLHLGFEPEYRDAEDTRRWDAVLAKLAP